MISPPPAPCPLPPAPCCLPRFGGIRYTAAVPETWAKYERLRTRNCDVEIRSFLSPDHPRWHVTIYGKRADDGPVTVDGNDLHMAMREAVRQAEARGWLSG